MDKKKIITLRTLAEAHLYVAVTKIDNHVSPREQSVAMYYAQKCNGLMDIMNIDLAIREKIVEQIKDLFNNSVYLSWSADNHLDEACNLFSQAQNLGDYTIKSVIDKHKSGLLKLAQVDNYLYKESLFLNKIQEALSKVPADLSCKQ